MVTILISERSHEGAGVDTHTVLQTCQLYDYFIASDVILFLRFFVTDPALSLPAFGYL